MGLLIFVCVSPGLCAYKNAIIQPKSGLIEKIVESLPLQTTSGIYHYALKSNHGGTYDETRIRKKQNHGKMWYLR